MSNHNQGQASAARTPPRERRYIVLAGSLRAGTTLLRLMLGQHAQVRGLGESDFLFDGVPTDEPATTEQLEHFRRRAVSPLSARLSGMVEPKGESYEAMLDDLLEQHVGDEAVVLLTLHRHFDVAAQHLPNAFFIRLQRDPRDVALSSVRMGWGGVPYYGVDPWMIAERDWIKAEPTIDERQKTFIRYEDLVADPRAEMQKILDLAGLPFDEAVLSPSENSTYDAPQAREAEPFRTKMSAREIEEINGRLDWLPETYGYNLQPVREVTGLRLLQLRLARYKNSLQFRLKRYGLWLATMQLVSKYLGRQFVPASVHQRTEAINLKHLK